MISLRFETDIQWDLPSNHLDSCILFGNCLSEEKVGKENPSREIYFGPATVQPDIGRQSNESRVRGPSLPDLWTPLGHHELLQKLISKSHHFPFAAKRYLGSKAEKDKIAKRSVRRSHVFHTSCSNFLFYNHQFICEILIRLRGCNNINVNLVWNYNEIQM